MSPSRSKAAEIARDTLEIVAAGQYVNPAGTSVSIRPLVDAAVASVVSYPPDAPLPKDAHSRRPGLQTRFTVLNDTTLSAALDLALAGHQPVALNFASARHPGGGFLNGARAQEESLCRASALYACIHDNAMYRHHAPLSGGLYTNYAIYAPAVPVFKDDAGDLLDEPYLCAFVTSPAVNAGVYTKDGGRRDVVRREMRERIEKTLAIMAGHGHDAAVLGAWGCGVFKNDPEMIADLFAEALFGRFAGVFARVVFAVLSSDGETIRPFHERFGSAAPKPEAN